MLIKCQVFVCSYSGSRFTSSAQHAYKSTTSYSQKTILSQNRKEYSIRLLNVQWSYIVMLTDKFCNVRYCFLEVEKMNSFHTCISVSTCDLAISAIVAWTVSTASEWTRFTTYYAMQVFPVYKLGWECSMHHSATTWKKKWFKSCRGSN